MILKTMYLTHKIDPSKYYNNIVSLGVMKMKGYSTLLRSPEMLPHNLMDFSVIHRYVLINLKEIKVSKVGDLS